jgi:uncharacterized iron-regulated protein
MTAQSYVPERVFETRRREFTDFERMLAEAAKADVVFVGEQHDDPNTHRLELAILEGLARRKTDAVLSLEMFERDVQEPLDHFVMGHLPEEEFLKASRPWPRYQTDYKPLVDFAIAKSWPVVAANVPRPLASEVAKGGREVLEAKTADERKLFAPELRCPTDDDYFERFAEAMGAHPGSDDAAKRQTTERYYYSQCLKDETMAESIARAVTSDAAAGRKRVVVHFNGAFHSDFGLGTAERTRRRLPGRRVVVITMMPVADLDAVSPDKEDRKRADFLVYTVRPTKS